MTMLSFRITERDAAAVEAWTKKLGIEKSELLREALRHELDRLASEDDAARWSAQPLDVGEQALAKIAEWGPAEDWSDWDADAPR